MSDLMEAINEFSSKLMKLGVTTDITIINEDLHNLAAVECSYRLNPNPKGVYGYEFIQLATYTGFVNIRKGFDPPTELIDREVRNELNQRELNRQRYGIRKKQ